jgi:hypothetical protein
MLLVHWVLKMALLGGVVYGLVSMEPPVIVKHALYAAGVYSFIGKG